MKSWPAARLAALIAGALERRGLSAEHAGYVVDGLLFASSRGIDTHGVRLLPTYLAELDGGRAKARPELLWQPADLPARAARVEGATGAHGSDRAAARRLDAGHALGMVAGRVAAAETAKLAKRYGVGAVAVANSNHFGAASYYTVEMARHDVVALAFTNSDALVAPHGGTQPMFGTNPLALAVRGEGDEVFSADLATSQVSYSRIKHHQRLGLPLEPGWVVADTAGSPAESPALQPLGGYKGQCLGMAVEILCCLLTGMPFDHQLSHLYTPPFDQPRQVSHLFLALDVGAFTELEPFRARLSQWLRLVREQPAAEGADPVQVPGDPERDAARARGDEIPLGDDELAALEAIEALG
jgi:LDH2 family malate/lactate/ureidoglycolate dehydrogenase